MELPLSPSTEKLIHEKILAGEYRDLTELVEEAISLLDERDREQRKKFLELKGMIDAAYQSSARGMSKPVDFDELRSAARAYHDERARKRA